MAAPSPGGGAIFLIDKAPGPTSHDIVALVRRLSGVRRVGHGGTLDPLASGLLPVFVGPATRLVEYLSEHDKRYAAAIRLGVRTDTDDAEGEPIETHPVPPLREAEIERALAQFRGAIQQRPPVYSAVKVRGVVAHRAARRGQPLDVAPRPAMVHDLSLAAWAPPLLWIRVRCGGGTYVRALARDIGAALGCGGHVVQMRRTGIGPVDVEEAITLAALAAAFDAGEGWAQAAAPQRFLQHWPHAELNERQCRDVSNGRPVRVPAAPAGSAHVLAHDRDGTAVAVLGPVPEIPGTWRPLKVLSGARGSQASGGSDQSLGSSASRARVSSSARSE